jgi:hypothetical protein
MCSQKNQDPEIWITELEDLQMQLEELGSRITDNQFMIHILRDMTLDYNLQIAIMEKSINNKVNPLRIAGIRDNLNLRFESLNMNANEKMKVKLLRILRYLVVSLKENQKLWGHR